MINNLQVLRAIAAMGVVFYHADYRLPGDLHTDFGGVAIFFVISGFIMSYITQKGERDFLLKRLIRIVPMYWIAIFISLLTSYRSHFFRASEWMAGDPPLLVDTIRSLLFAPWDKFPVLGVGWSLNFEVYFYVLFAAMLLISRRFAPVLTAAVVLLVIAADRQTGGQVFVLHYYAHDYIAFFVYGIGLYYFIERVPFAVGIAFGVLCAIYLPWSVVIVAAALLAERAGLSITWRPILLLGEASYSIYLLHTILFEQLRPHLFVSARESVWVMLFSVTLAGIVGVVTYLWLEKPLLDRLRDGIRSRVKSTYSPAAVSV